MTVDEILKRRAEAHRAACAELENDPLLRAVFEKPGPLSLLPSPLSAGALLKRQAS